NAALTVLLELKRPGQHVARLAVGFQVRRGHRLPVALLKHGIWVGRVDVGRGAAVAEQNDVVGLSMEGKGVIVMRPSGGGRSDADGACEAEESEAAAHGLQCFAASEHKKAPSSSAYSYRSAI